MTPQLLTLPETAAALGLSRRTLEREIAAGRLAVVQIRRAVRVAQSDVDAYIQRSRRYRVTEPCPSANVVPLGMSASKARASELSAALAQVLPGRKRSR